MKHVSSLPLCSCENLLPWSFGPKGRKKIQQQNPTLPLPCFVFTLHVLKLLIAPEQMFARHISLCIPYHGSCASWRTSSATTAFAECLHSRPSADKSLSYAWRPHRYDRWLWRLTGTSGLASFASDNPVHGACHLLCQDCQTSSNHPPAPSNPDYLATMACHTTSGVGYQLRHWTNVRPFFFWWQMCAYSTFSATPWLS